MNWGDGHWHYTSSYSGTHTHHRCARSLHTHIRFSTLFQNHGSEHVFAEDMVKLAKQDRRGRRPKDCPLNAQSELVKPSKQVSGGESGPGRTVVYPATKYALECQAIYKEFFGAKRLPSRSLMTPTPEEQAQARILASKPHLGRVPGTSSQSNAQTAALGAHAQGDRS